MRSNYVDVFGGSGSGSGPSPGSGSGSASLPPLVPSPGQSGVRSGQAEVTSGQGGVKVVVA